MCAAEESISTAPVRVISTVCVAAEESISTAPVSVISTVCVAAEESISTAPVRVQYSCDTAIVAVLLQCLDV